MTKGSLPDGVPSDNLSGLRKGDSASFDGRGAKERPHAAPLQNIAGQGIAGPGVIFAAPEMAIPNFAEPAPESLSESGRTDLNDNASCARFSRVVLEVEDDDEDEDEKIAKSRTLHGPHLPAPMLILIAIGLLLAALGAYVTSQNQDPQPYCSQQPAWNQYNCQAD